MSFQALEWARKLPIPPAPKFLIMVIASYTDTDDACFPALTTLAEDTRQSVDSVRRQIVKCQGAGLLVRFPRWSVGDAVAVGKPGDQCPRGCRRTSDRIQLLLSADLAAVELAFDPDVVRKDDTPPVADCEGDGSKNGGDSATTPVAPMVLPQEDSLDPESERETRAREDKRPSVKRFLLKWPTAAIDDKAHIARAWEALPIEECEPCMNAIDPWLAKHKAHGRKHIPAGWKYIEDRPWKLIDKPAAGSLEYATFDCWSREWWAVLVQRASRGQRPGYMLTYALERGNKPFSLARAEMPPEDEISKFRSYPSDGQEMVAWRPWFDRCGVKLPRWNTRIWVHLPAPCPPRATSTGPPDLSNEDIKAFTGE